MELKIVPGPKVTVVEKSPREEFRIQVKEHRGHNFFNCHVWYRAPDGQMRPGKGDLSVRAEKARGLLAAMEEVLIEAGF